MIWFFTNAITKAHHRWRHRGVTENARSERTSHRALRGAIPAVPVPPRRSQSPQKSKNPFSALFRLSWPAGIPACPGWAGIRNFECLPNGNDLRGRCCGMGTRTSQKKTFSTYVSHHSQPFSSPNSVAYFFY